MEAKYISCDGRQYSKRPSFTSDYPEEQKQAFDKEISKLMFHQIEVIVRSYLVPLLKEIHWTSTDLGSLFNIVSYRPIVPPGRVEFFFSGIRSGLEGDFLAAAHILIPQLENSLRFTLEIRGFVVTCLDSENLHSEMSLNKIFEKYRKEISEIFGSGDLMYILESFLCSKTGENFRNELSHGLINTVYDYRCVFAWWLTVYLLFLMKFSDKDEDIDT